MSANASGALEGGLLDRHHFLFRRLHSLSGILPIGLFVCFHLFTNMQMAFGTFQHEVDWIHSQPALLFMEIGVLWLPIAFHAGLGLIYTFTGKSNVGSYGYADNWRYVLQRVTGIIALIFIFFHVATLRWRWNIVGWDTPFFTHALTGDGSVIPFAHESTAIALQVSPLVAIAYIICVYAAVYHFANGLWTAAITWGITTTPAAMKRWGAVCILVGLGVGGFATMAFYGALTHDTEPDMQAYELTKSLYSEANGYRLLHAHDMVHPLDATIDLENLEVKLSTDSEAH